jgi:hypothetical protein
MEATLGPLLEQARLTTPGRQQLHGLSVDCRIRVRKGGRQIDLLNIAPRFIAPLLLALEQAFDKPVVPVGTLVQANCERLETAVYFVCSDANGSLSQTRPLTFVS